MTYTAYYLKFTTPLHIGDYKPDTYENSESYLRSDTIIAAIIATWAKSGHGDWIGDGNLPFTISSAFPFYMIKKDENVEFHPLFPRIKRPFLLKEYDPKMSKALKKITWMDLHYFIKSVNGGSFDDFDSAHLQGEVLSASELPKDFMYKQISERVKIPRDRSSEDSDPFYMERIYFNSAGLYFIATGDELEKLEKALNVLKYEGFGTDRNIGNGFFEWEKGVINITSNNDSEYSTNLGLYCPESQDTIRRQIDTTSSYDIIRRGGWITTEGYQTLEKKSIYMISEGSVLKNREKVCGFPNHNLKPDTYPISHNIFRCGRTIFIPVKL
jgi:CRISPR-associated protein Csm4